MIEFAGTKTSNVSNEEGSKLDIRPAAGSLILEIQKSKASYAAAFVKHVLLGSMERIKR